MSPANGPPPQAGAAVAVGGGHSYSSMFLGAPLSKLVTASTVIAYVSINAKRSSLSAFDFNASRIRDRDETYRYLTSKVTFSSTGELVVGTLLLGFLMRKFEREMGTRKIFFFCIFVQAAAMATEAFLVYANFLSFNLQYAGPFPLIGALFALYHGYTPRLHPRFFSFWGIHFSEKIFHYIWLIQVASSNGWNSIYAVGIGWFSALLYELLPVLKQTDVPDVVADFFGDVIGSRLLEAPPRILVPPAARGGRAYTRVAAAVVVAAAGGGGPGIRPAAQRPVAANADPAAVEQLTHMGFSRTQVVEALKSTNNDVQRAAERLLTQQGAQ